MVTTVSWRPRDEVAGREVGIEFVSGDGPLVLTGDDLARWAFQYLVEAELNLDLWAISSGLRVAGPYFSESRLVCAPERRSLAASLRGVWPGAEGKRGYFVGDAPRVLYRAPSAVVRRLVRVARKTMQAPTYRPTVTEPLVRNVGRSAPGFRLVGEVVNGGLRVGVPVLILIGVLGVAALAGGAWIGREAVQQSYEVDRYEARLAAETQLKGQVAYAQIAQGRSVDLDALVVGAARADTYGAYVVPATLGAVGLTGVAAWLYERSKAR